MGKSNKVLPYECRVASSTYGAPLYATIVKK